MDADPSFPSKAAPIRALIITRAPVGGLWRHILDLTDGLLDRGAELGILVDSLRASEHVRATLERFGPRLALGVHTLDIPRLPGIGDLRLSMQCRALVDQLKPDIVHGHSAKGGLYARLAAWGLPAKAIYTPHGGSLHYDWNTPSGAGFLAGERAILPLTDQFLFESAYSARGFAAKIGNTAGREKVVFNGLRDSEFVGGPQTIENPSHDFAFVGEMRVIKGVDLVLEATRKLAQNHGRQVKVLMLGDGPLMADYQNLAQALGVGAQVDFAGRRPVREAFAATNTILVPSRAESLPYIVMESIAAGKHVIASRVGGIGEIFGPAHEELVEPDNVDALCAAMLQALQPPTPEQLAMRAARYAFVAANFHVDTMVEQVWQTYQALARPQGAR